MTDKNATIISFSLFFYLATFILYFYLHEFAGHYLANLISGISIDQMEIIWFRTESFKLLPFGITINDGEIPKITPFAGGFVSCLILGLVSIFVFLRLYRKNKKELYWWFFNITLAFSLVGFTEFIIEGFFPEFHRGIVEAMIISFFTFFFVPIFGAWHLRKNIFNYGKIHH